MQEIIKFFDEEEKNILQALTNGYGLYRAERIFVEDYKKSNIPLAVALRRIRNIRSKIENLKPQGSGKSQDKLEINEEIQEAYQKSRNAKESDNSSSEKDCFKCENCCHITMCKWKPIDTNSCDYWLGSPS